MKLWICVVGGEENPEKYDDERVVCRANDWDSILESAAEYQTEVDTDIDKYFWVECEVGAVDPIGNTYEEFVNQIEYYK